jgi:phosphate transport system ATP-binding protein
VVSSVLDEPAAAYVAAVGVTHNADGPELCVRELSAWYGARQTIDRISLRIAPRQVTAIIGPSGCGKSTLIRCLNRMHEVVPGARASGSVELNGLDIYGPRVDPVRVRRVIGMVFQKPNPFPMMTIFENTVAGLRLQGGYRTRELEDIAERALRKRPSGTRSRTCGRRPPASRSRAASSSGCASRARWPWSRR